MDGWKRSRWGEDGGRPGAARRFHAGSLARPDGGEYGRTPTMRSHEARGEGPGVLTGVFSALRLFPS